MKKILLLLSLFCSAVKIFATGTNDFVFTINTSLATGSGANKFLIPCINGGYSFSVDWGEGGGFTDTYTGTAGSFTGSGLTATHTYATAGTYTIRMQPNTVSGIPRMYFANGASYGTDKLKITAVTQWGTNKWTNFNSAFNGCANLTSLTGSDNPNLSLTTDMGAAFANCPVFNSDLSGWDVHTITSLYQTFSGCTVFNSPLNSWNVSAVTGNGFYQTFLNCAAFNQPLNSWDISKGTNFTNMFQGCTAFNQDISSWNTAAGTIFTNMFALCSAFNQPLNSWNVGAATNFTGMFYNCFAFNQPLNSWNVAAVTNFSSMFYGCTAFNQPLDSWNVSAGTVFTSMLRATKAFNQPLPSWNMANATAVNAMFFDADAFDQPLTWNLGKATDLTYMFSQTAIFNSPLNFTLNTGALPANAVSLAFMFESAVKFNQDISGWNTTNVTNLQQTFNTASAFNKPLAAWDVSHVTNFFATFQSAVVFNQPLNSWNTSAATNFQQLFNNAYSFNQPLSSWDVSHVTNYTNTFSSAVVFDQPLNTWDVSAATTFSSMFNTARAFNQDLSGWNTKVSNASIFTNMFANASKFNGNITGWQTTNATNMSYMFYTSNRVSVFNQDISGWDVSKVTTFSNMFNGAVAFNQPVGNWTPALATNFQGMFAYTYAFNKPLASWAPYINKTGNNVLSMFYYARVFNQDLCAWNMDKINDFATMFYYAQAFNQDLSCWNINALNTTPVAGVSAPNTSMYQMLTGSKLSRLNYEKTIIGWNTQATALGKTGQTLGAATLAYCIDAALTPQDAAITAHANLAGTLGWTITDLACGPGGISNPNVWLKANDNLINTPGAAVSQWDDATGSGDQATNATAAEQPIVSNTLMNFNQQVAFDGVDDRLVGQKPLNNVIKGTTPFSIFTVYNKKSTTAGTIYGSNATLGTGFPYINSTTTTNFWIDTLGTATFSSAAANINTNYISNIIRTNATTGYTHSLNGATTSNATAPNTYNFLSAEYTLGRNSSAGGPAFNGTIAEVIAYPSNQNTGSNRQRINSYLALKYGLQLTTIQNYIAGDGTTLMWNMAASNANGVVGGNPAMNKNIFGIGSDPASGLYQRVSKSQDPATSDILTLSTQNDFTSSNNDAARTAQLDDLTYTVISNNGVAMTTSTPWSAAGLASNLPGYRILTGGTFRQWMVQENSLVGNVGNVYLQIDLGNAPAPVNNKYFIAVDPNNDGNYSDGYAVELTKTTGNLWVTASGIDFTNANAGTAAVVVRFTLATAGQSDLAVAYQTPATNSLPNTELDYTFNVSNSGADTAYNASLSIPAIANYTVTGISCTATGTATCPVMDEDVNINIAAIQAGTMVIPKLTVGAGNYLTFTINGTSAADCSAAPASIANTVIVVPNSGTYDPVLANDTSRATTAITPVNAGLDQSICNNLVLPLKGNGTSGNWSAAAANPTVVTVSAAVAGRATATLTSSEIGGYKFIYDYNGCKDTVLVTATAAPVPSLSGANNSMTAVMGCPDTTGAYSFVNSTDASVKCFSINPNGNTGYNFTATQSENSALIAAQPASQTTDGTANTTAFMGRMYTITDAGANNYPSGMTVRLYYSAADSAVAVSHLDAGVTGGTLKGQWFKVEGGVADVLNAQLNWGLKTIGSHTATYITPSAYGAEGGLKYVEFSGINNFSTFGFIAGKTLLPLTLPINLSDFNATAVNNKYVEINWQTASEINNDYFSIERSTDGNKWETVTKVKSAGNSGSPKNYSAIDNNPFTGITYYRIKQTDLDGKYVYSNTKAVKIDKTASGTVVIYPNPVTNQLSIKADAAELKTVIIYDMVGQDVSRIIKTILSNNGKIVLDVSKLAPGTYSIKTKTSVTKILKQ